MSGLPLSGPRELVCKSFMVGKSETLEGEYMC